MIEHNAIVYAVVKRAGMLANKSMQSLRDLASGAENEHQRKQEILGWSRGELIEFILQEDALVASENCLILSAGFVVRKNEGWEVTQEKSISLKMGPTWLDQDILNFFLDDGLAGLELQNMIAFANIQKNDLPTRSQIGQRRNKFRHLE